MSALCNLKWKGKCNSWQIFSFRFHALSRFVSERCLSLYLFLILQAVRRGYLVLGCLSLIWTAIKDQQQVTYCATSTEDERPLICEWLPRQHHWFKGNWGPQHIKNKSRKTSQELVDWRGKEEETEHKMAKGTHTSLWQLLMSIYPLLANLRKGKMDKTTKAPPLMPKNRHLPSRWRQAQPFTGKCGGWWQC